MTNITKECIVYTPQGQTYQNIIVSRGNGRSNRYGTMLTLANGTELYFKDDVFMDEVALEDEREAYITLETELGKYKDIFEDLKITLEEVED